MKDLRKAVAGLALFEGVDSAIIDRIIEKGSLRAVHRDEVVVTRGETLEVMYIVLGGRLSMESEVRATDLSRGDTIGVLALIGVDAAYFTVRGRHDAQLLALPVAFMKGLLAEDATFLVNALRHAALQLGAAQFRATRSQNLLVAVYSAPAGVGKTRFAANFAAALATETRERTLVVDVATERKRLMDFFSLGGAVPLVELRDLEYGGRDIVAEKGRKHEAGFEILRVAHHPERSEDASSVAPLLSTLARHVKNIVVDLPPIMNETVWKFLQHCDAVIVITLAENRHIDQTANLLQKLPSAAKVVIGRGSDAVRMRLEGIEERLHRGVDEVLDDMPEDDVIVYRPDSPARYARSIRRLARTLSGRAVGLALSAGAARGMSHVGVLRVLEEEGIYPDYIAGTSIGALIGAMWSMGHSATVLERIARRIRRKDFFSLTDLSLPPTTSLLKGVRIESFIRKIFGDHHFSELSTPLRIAAADIDTGEVVIRERGLIREAVMASIAIPGVLPPTELGGRMLIDGAVNMPVPVAALTALGVTRIIAVNTIPTPESMKDSRRAKLHRMLGKKGWLHRLRAVKNAIPNVLDIMVRSNQFMEALIATDNCLGASVVIRPWLPEIHWIDFDASARFIEAGARAAREALPEIRSLVES